MYTLIPSISHPFNLSQSAREELRKSCLNLKDLIPPTKASDGGGKLKITSNNRMLWRLDKAIEIADPILSAMESFISKDFVEKAFYLIKSKSDSPLLENKKSIRLVSAKNLKSIGNKHQKLFSVSSNTGSSYIIENINRISKHYPDILFVLMRFHISYMIPGSFIQPHRDTEDKLLSAMLYLPSKDQLRCPDLSTIFYTSREINDSIYFEKGKITDPVRLKAFYDTHNEFRPDFDSENIVLFARSNESWHSFAYPKDLHLGERISININFHSATSDSSHFIS